MNVQSKIAAEQQAQPLRIRRADAIAIAVPLAKPMMMEAETITHAENVVLRLEAENGLVGWGEATVAPTMTGDTLPGMVAAVRQHMAPLLVGADVRDRAEVSRRCRAAIAHNGGAKAAAEIALLDLAGKHPAFPRWNWSAGRCGARSRTVAARQSRHRRRHRRGQAQGRRGLWLFQAEGRREAGREGDRGRVAGAQGARARRDAVRRRQYRRDARKAKAYMRGVEDAGLLFLEQPLPTDQLEGMGALNRLGLLPISGDECVGGSDDVLALGQGGIVSGVNLKVIKTEGIMPLLAAATLCKQLGLSVTLAGKVAGTSLTAAATLVAACASPVLDWGVSLTQVYLADDVVRDPLRLENGKFSLRDAPGLGVDVDEDAIKRFTVN